MSKRKKTHDPASSGSDLSDQLPDGELDEKALFSAAMQDVAPIASPLKPAGEATNKAADESLQRLHAQRRDAALGLNQTGVDPNFLTLGEVPARQPLEYLEWKKDGVQRAVYDKLRRGGYPLQGNLDLHRKTVAEARKLVFDFLQVASARDWRNLLISPGKGEFSSTPGRLKSYLAAWLAEHPEVIAYCSALRQHGGVGAVYVLVRKSQDSSEVNRQQHGGKSDPVE